MPKFIENLFYVIDRNTPTWVLTVVFVGLLVLSMILACHASVK